MPNNYSRKTYDRHPDKIERNHLCPLCGAFVMPFLGILGTEHKGHCPKCGTVTYVSMPETVTHEFTSYIRSEFEQEQHKALKIVLDVTTQTIAPVATAKIVRLDWQIEAEAQAADTTAISERWSETSESYKNSQPYHNDLYPY